MLGAIFRGPKAAIALTAAMLATHRGTASAPCRLSQPAILWSYPAPDQADVPLDASLWLRLSRPGAPAR